MKVTRAEAAGRKMGNSIKEMVNLMYQNSTALNFLYGLVDVIFKEKERREREFVKNGTTKR
jgi:hypothetical protein